MPSVSTVKSQFETILKIRSDIQTVFDILDGKLGVLKGIFDEIMKTHGHKDFVFGIDSFHFQNKLIETDYNNLTTIYRHIDNRIYCEYYNLYLMVQNYGKELIDADKLKKMPNFQLSFAAYRHLDTKVKYDIEVIKQMQDAVTGCLTDLETHLTSKEQELNNDEEQSRLGLNIDNLVYTEMYRNAMLKARIEMFYKYLTVFHEHHSKYYTRLLLKVKLHLGIVNEDILIKQFNQQATTTDLQDMPSLKTGTSPVGQMDVTEEKAIRSYVNYEEMGGSRKDVLDHIISSAGNSSGSDNDSIRSGGRGTPRLEDDASTHEESVEIDIASVPEDNKEVANSDNMIVKPEPISEKPTTEVKDAVNSDDTLVEPDTIVSEESVKNVSEEPDTSISSEEDSQVNAIVEPDATIAFQDMPEESEIASAMGEAACPFEKDDIGTRCMVEGYNSIGTIRFVGEHIHAGGFRVGVELDDAIGRNNGTVRDHKYFECEDKKGVLVAPHKVSKVDDSL